MYYGNTASSSTFNRKMKLHNLNGGPVSGSVDSEFSSNLDSCSSIDGHGDSESQTLIKKLERNWIENSESNLVKKYQTKTVTKIQESDSEQSLLKRFFRQFNILESDSVKKALQWINLIPDLDLTKQDRPEMQRRPRSDVDLVTESKINKDQNLQIDTITGPNLPEPGITPGTNANRMNLFESAATRMLDNIGFFPNSDSVIYVSYIALSRFYQCRFSYHYDYPNSLQTKEIFIFIHQASQTNPDNVNVIMNGLMRNLYESTASDSQSEAEDNDIDSQTSTSNYNSKSQSYSQLPLSGAELLYKLLVSQSQVTEDNESKERFSQEPLFLAIFCSQMVNDLTLYLMNNQVEKLNKNTSNLNSTYCTTQCQTVSTEYLISGNKFFEITRLQSVLVQKIEITLNTVTHFGKNQILDADSQSNFETSESEQQQYDNHTNRKSYAQANLLNFDKPNQNFELNEFIDIDNDNDLNNDSESDFDDEEPPNSRRRLSAAEQQPGPGNFNQNPSNSDDRVLSPKKLLISCMCTLVFVSGVITVILFLTGGFSDNKKSVSRKSSKKSKSSKKTKRSSGNKKSSQADSAQKKGKGKGQSKGQSQYYGTDWNSDWSSGSGRKNRKGKGKGKSSKTADAPELPPGCTIDENGQIVIGQQSAANATRNLALELNPKKQYSMCGSGITGFCCSCCNQEYNEEEFMGGSTISACFILCCCGTLCGCCLCCFDNCVCTNQIKGAAKAMNCDFDKNRSLKYMIACASYFYWTVCYVSWCVPIWIPPSITGQLGGPACNMCVKVLVHYPREILHHYDCAAQDFLATTTEPTFHLDQTGDPLQFLSNVGANILFSVKHWGMAHGMGTKFEIGMQTAAEQTRDTGPAIIDHTLKVVASGVKLGLSMGTTAAAGDAKAIASNSAALTSDVLKVAAGSVKGAHDAHAFDAGVTLAPMTSDELNDDGLNFMPKLFNDHWGPAYNVR